MLRRISGSNCLFHTKSKLFSKAKEPKLVQLADKWKHKTLEGLASVARDNKGHKIYILSQFPYPSGVLHIGHLRVYAISDTLNRFYQQKGYDVLHPMGWDAFGLPAENAAIERQIDPSEWTTQNIAKMKDQMSKMLANFDWDKEITTCSPEYYKFTQMIFLKLFEQKLAYQKEAEINWDPVDKTVLANEQVDAQGRSWRSGAVVEKRLLKQWFLGITKFAKELKNDLKYLDGWPTKVKRMQRNWIGQSIGAEIDFLSDDAEFPKVKVFTTRAETLFSVQYVALALDHEIVRKHVSLNPSLRSFIEEAKMLPEDSKRGFLLNGIKLENPLTKREVPVYVAPYVLGNYGHGAVMGCPAHDERDFAFWQENALGQPVIACLEPLPGEEVTGLPFTSPDAVMNKSTAEYNGLFSAEARHSITSKLKSHGLAEFVIQYRLRDWLISRQRYWGTPIPIIHCGECGPVPVPEEDLPVLLPKVAGLKSKGNPLSQIPEFVNVDCPSCGKPAKRETDTMDTFMDSSWYFFRYTDPHNTVEPFSYEEATQKMPVDIYIGGVEHAILHLLYSRFIAKFLGSIGMWNGEQLYNEPFKRLITQGMVHGKTYSDPETGRFLKQDELVHFNDAEVPVRIKVNGAEPIVTYEKMSKSKYNGADFNECISKHGPDATRAHILFQAPIEDVLLWDESKIVGIERWLFKILGLSSTISNEGTFDPSYKTPSDMNQEEVKLHNDVQKLLKSINDSLEDHISLNTVISDYMKFTNALETATKKGLIRNEILMLNLQKLVTIIYPVVPTISEEAADIINQAQEWEWNPYKWPELEKKTESSTLNFQVVVNGRMRFMYTAERDFVKNDRNTIVSRLMALPEGRKYLLNRDIKKLILKNNIISFMLAKKGR